MIDKGTIKSIVFLAIVFSLSTGNVVGSIVGAAVCGVFAAYGAKLNAKNK